MSKKQTVEIVRCSKQFWWYEHLAAYKDSRFDNMDLLYPKEKRTFEVEQSDVEDLLITTEGVVGGHRGYIDKKDVW